MYRHQYRCEVRYGHFREFVQISQEIAALEQARGWAVSSIWTPTVGPANEAVIIAEYASLGAFEQERQSRYGDAEYMRLARRAEDLMVQGSFRDELLEEAPELLA